MAYNNDSKDFDMKGPSVDIRPASFDDREKGKDYDANVKIHDEVFGDITDSGPNYRGVSICGGWRSGLVAVHPATQPCRHS